MYKCKGCGKKFRQLRNIKNHIRLKDDDIHGRYNSYGCKFETLEQKQKQKQEDGKPRFEEINMPGKKEEGKEKKEKEEKEEEKDSDWYKFDEFSDEEAFQDVINKLEKDGYSEMNIETGEVR